MNPLSRREFLLWTGAVVVIPHASAEGQHTSPTQVSQLLICDEHLEDIQSVQQRLTAVGRWQAYRPTDNAIEQWRALRAFSAAKVDRIVGITRWSDYVIFKGAFEEQGRRLVAPETLLSLARDNDYVYWMMA